MIVQRAGAKRLFMPSMGISVVEPMGAAAPAWVPTDIPGCVLWLDASAITGLVDGDPVGTWIDLSGNLNHATQTTTASKPTYKTGIQNGLPIVRLDGTDDWLRNNTIAALGEFTLFITWAGEYDWSLFSFGSYAPEVYSTIVGLAAWPAGVWTDLIPPANTWHIADWWRASNAYNAALDGANSALNPKASAYADTPQFYEIASETYAGSAFYTGDYAEILVYDTALGNVNRGLVEDYLGAKWGITVA